MVKIAVFMFALFSIATIAAAYAIALFNALVDAKHQVEQAWSGIDVLLRQRHDEVPGLVEMLGAHGGTDSALLERVSGLFSRGWPVWRVVRCSQPQNMTGRTWKSARCRRSELGTRWSLRPERVGRIAPAGCEIRRPDDGLRNRRNTSKRLT